MCVYVCVCVSVKEGECVCVCVCVCERERERERMRLVSSDSVRGKQKHALLWKCRFDNSQKHLSCVEKSYNFFGIVRNI